MNNAKILSGAFVLCTLPFLVSADLQVSAFTYTPIDAEIPVSCADVTGEQTHLYEIAMEPESENAPRPENSAQQIREDGRGSFIITLTEPGTYVYQIAETPGTEDAVIYDDTVYRVTVFAQNGTENQLVYSISALTADGQKHESILFSDEVAAQPVETETAVTSSQTEAMSTSSTAAQMTTVTETTAPSTASPSIISRIGNVLTGDSTPVALLITLIASGCAAASVAFLLRRKSSGNSK